ncbi:MAG: sulfatase [candidate division WS1 bacterium]|nr:sulfatase [candidate division WS1 bacterium]
MSEAMNLVLIVSDTLRTAELGCYGNEQILTPKLDAFAQRSVRFTEAYPESLPTIPVRRALHTGRRCYPFRDYRPLKWDIVYLPGWQALSNEEDTLAENLAAAGYETGFVTDTLPYFAPGFNFQRGFWQYEYIRGQQQDRWRSPYAVPAERRARYDCERPLAELSPAERHGVVPMHLANTAHVESEEDTTTARTFSWAMRFLEENQAGQPFYLLVDCFDPHEPWEAPDKYYRLYGEADYSGRRIIHCGYGPAAELGYTEAEIAYVYAHYRGLVTLFDTWFGKFMARLEALGLAENTAVIVISDHGTNFCDNPRQVIGKPANAMYPGVMRLPLLVHLPGKPGAGTTCNETVYNLDVTATLYDLAGSESPQGVDGQSLRPLLTGEGTWQPREYVTCRYGNELCYLDRDWWMLMDLEGEAREVFDRQADPGCQRPLAGAAGPRALAWERVRQDAQGELPDYRGARQTDAIGERRRS